MRNKEEAQWSNTKADTSEVPRPIPRQSQDPCSIIKHKQKSEWPKSGGGCHCHCCKYCRQNTKWGGGGGVQAARRIQIRRPPPGLPRGAWRVKSNASFCIILA